MFKTRAPSCQALDGSKVASQIIRVHNGRSRASAMGRGCVKTYVYFVFGGPLTLPHSKIIECSAF